MRKHERLAICAVAVMAFASGSGVMADGIHGQGTWESTLLPRDLNGDGVTDAFYDTALDITWLREVNVTALMTWDSATSWANSLAVGGVGGWRLPTLVDVGTPGCNYAYSGTDCGYNVMTMSGGTVFSEMAHLFYITLGNKGTFDANGIPQAGVGLTNTGGFQNLSPVPYFFGLDYAPNPNLVWMFYMGVGLQSYNYKDAYFGSGNGPYAIAVHAGDVSAVPEPHARTMVLASLTAFVMLRRLRRKAGRTCVPRTVRPTPCRPRPVRPPSACSSGAGGRA